MGAQKLEIKKSAVPAGSLASKYLPANYSDAFCCEFTTEKEVNANELSTCFWTHQPEWIRMLFKLRNILVKPFGLQTSNEENNDQTIINVLEAGATTSLASLSDKSDTETVLCLNDKHLKAYAAIYVENNEVHKRVTLSTIVHFHNLLGYVYFYAICPFHMLVVKSSLKHSIRSLYFS